MKATKIFTPIFFTAAISTVAVSRNVAWTASPFNQKVFVENNGQFDGKSGDRASKILFGFSRKGVDLYFSKSGLTYRYDEYVAMTKAESEVLATIESKEYEMEEKEGMVKSVPQYLSMEWVGANPAAEIITADPVTFYYTYAAEKGTITAHAYKKIIYKNLYPNIDVEYVLPEGKEGIKYTIIVHPGGDVSLIKMRYSGASRLERDDNGNVTITSSFGDFIDHAPTSSVNMLAIPSSFVISGNEIVFRVANYDKNETLVIDPWLVDPAFDGYDAAYDVNYDQEGNVYAYGSFAPLELVKFNPLGELQWVFVADNFGKLNGKYGVYGDFAVDEVSGTSYLVEGFRDVGARVLKVNTTGIQTGEYAGSNVMQEMWRVEYNRCTNKIVIGGGGTKSRNQAAMLDTNLVNITPVNVLSAKQPFLDIALLAIDNDSNFCFMGTARTSANINNFYKPMLIKCPIPNLIPLAFSVEHGHEFQEVGSITYINGNDTSSVGFRSTNSMNGIAVNSNWVYTYDSDSLKRWNKHTGALVATRDISPSAPVYGGYSKTGIQVSWGGLAASDCDNLYIGLKNTLAEYDSTLTLRNTIALPDTVYDVKLGPNNKLYACGKGFLTQLDVRQDNLFTITKPPGCDSCGGTATINICSNHPEGITYSWNTTPVQTTQTATGLCPGTYTVTVTKNCSIDYTNTVTIHAINVTPVIVTIGKQPGDEISIPIFLTPTTKLTTAKEIALTVKYDPALLRFVNVKSSVGTVSNVNSLNGELSFTVTLSTALSTPTATIAELQMQALLAPYSEGEIEVTQSKITLESGEQIAGGNCPVAFSLDSSCVMPHELRHRSSAVITGLYPNPSRNNVTMEVHAENGPDIRIEVYDAFGRKVESFFNGKVNEGKNEFILNTESYANGIYFCRLVNNSKMMMKAFNVER